MPCPLRMEKVASTGLRGGRADRHARAQQPGGRFTCIDVSPRSLETALARVLVAVPFNALLVLCFGRGRVRGLYFPEEMLVEIEQQAQRLDRSLSWVVQPLRLGAT